MLPRLTGWYDPVVYPDLLSQPLIDGGSIRSNAAAASAVSASHTWYSMFNISKCSRQSHTKCSNARHNTCGSNSYMTHYFDQGS